VILLFMTGTISSCEPNYTQENGAIMNVKVISLEKCGATPPTIALVEDVAREMGITLSLEHIIVKTRQEAEIYRHIGSPTIQINGRDIDPGAREINQFGLT